MRIGIIGAGSVGSTLARAWANSGHHVALATRNPDDPKLATLALSIGPNASAGCGAQGGRALRGGCAGDALDRGARHARRGGRLVRQDPDRLHQPAACRFHPGSRTTTRCPPPSASRRGPKGASVFKTLNHTGANNMANPLYPDGRAVMFVCGDDAAAKPTVLQLVAELGFEGRWMPASSRSRACSSR